MVSRYSKVDNFAISLFLCWLLLGLVFWPRLGDPCVCQSSMRVYVCHFLGQVLGYVYTICLYGQISISFTSPSGSPCPFCRVYSYILSALICCIRLFCDLWFHLCHHIAYICWGFFLVLSILALIWLILTALSCAAIRRDSVSLKVSFFFSHIQVLSREMLFISCLNRPQSCFPSHFYFLVMVILLSIVLLFLLSLLSY